MKNEISLSAVDLFTKFKIHLVNKKREVNGWEPVKTYYLYAT